MFTKLWQLITGLLPKQREKLIGSVRPGARGRHRLFVEALDGEDLAMSNPKGRALQEDAFRQLERLRDGEIEIRYD